MKVTYFAMVAVTMIGCASPTEMGDDRGTFLCSDCDFNIDYRGFEKETVLYAAGLAAVSYENDIFLARRKLMSEGSGYEMSCVDLVAIPETDRRILIARDGENLFISVNGSGPLKDWYNNVKFMAYETVGYDENNPYKGIPPAASGFRKLYSEMRRGLVEAINYSPCYNQFESSRIYYAGHSLGAALGILAGKDLCDGRHTSDTICFSGMFLFASPLVTRPDVFEDKAFPKGKIIVVQNYLDFVVRAGERGEFAHPGTVYVLKDGGVEEFDQAEKYTRYSWWEKLTGQLVRDHPIKSYIQDIKEIDSQSLAY